MDPDKDSEEFNNFMYRATEVNSIVKQLCSGDPAQYEIASQRADAYLGNGDAEKNLIYDEAGEVIVKYGNDRSVINKKALKELGSMNAPTMEVESFKNEVERDAQRRYQDKKVRREKSDTLKVQGNKAFRRGEYERALTCYNKAIDFIRDSPLLYTNRALTLIKLGLWKRARDDCTNALELCETRGGEIELKALLYSAQASHAMNLPQERDEFLQRATTNQPRKAKFIQEFADEFIFLGKIEEKANSSLKDDSSKTENAKTGDFEESYGYND